MSERARGRSVRFATIVGSAPTAADSVPLSTNPGDPPSFSSLGIEQYRALPRAARTMLLALWREAEGRAYERGYAALAQKTGKSVRTVERTLALLFREGFVTEQKRQFGETLQLCVHPGTKAFAIAEAATPRSRRAPAPPTRLSSNSTALQCAAVRRPDGSRYLPIPYVVGLMTDREREICERVAALGGGPICSDHDLSAALIANFRRLAQWEQFAIAERQRGALNRARQLSNDVPHYIDDHDREDAA
jgi:hypothetical protein